MSFQRPTRFKNRIEAGELLARRLTAYARRQDAIVLALPRGGVPVGFAVAKALEIQLDVLLVRKLGLPGQEEFAMGAIANGGIILRQEVMRAYGISDAMIEPIVRREMHEIERRESLYRAGRVAADLRERVLILVDDGLATGATMQVAVQVARKADPAYLIVAVPVAPAESVMQLKSEVDELVCLSTPESFYAVGQWYDDFEQTSDAEVIYLLDEAARDHTRRTGHA